MRIERISGQKGSYSFVCDIVRVFEARCISETKHPIKHKRFIYQANELPGRKIGVRDVRDPILRQLGHVGNQGIERGAFARVDVGL